VQTVLTLYALYAADDWFSALADLGKVAPENLLFPSSLIPGYPGI